MRSRWATVTVRPISRGGSIGELLLPASTAEANTTSTRSMVSRASMTKPPAGVVLAELIPFTPRLHFSREAKWRTAAPAIAPTVWATM